MPAGKQSANSCRYTHLQVYRHLKKNYFCLVPVEMLIFHLRQLVELSASAQKVSIFQHFNALLCIGKVIRPA